LTLSSHEKQYGDEKEIKECVALSEHDCVGAPVERDLRSVVTWVMVVVAVVL